MTGDSSSANSTRWISWASAFAIAITPIIVAYIGGRFATAATKQQSSVELLKLSVNILQAGKGDSTNALRQWAVQVLSAESPIPLSPDLKDALSKGEVRLPGTVSWTSSASDVVTITNSGIMTAIRPGSATITACLGTICNSSPVTVVPAESAQTGPNTFRAGQSIKIEAHPSAELARP